MKNKIFFSPYLAEFIGTFFIVFMGCMAIILSELKIGMMGEISIPLVFGATISIMIYSVGHISGAHFNPAVTLAFFCNKKFPANRLLGYLSAQFSGALFASFLHFLLFAKLNHDFGQTHINIGLTGAFFLEVLCSFMLMFVITAVSTDSRAIGEIAGVAIGLTVTICALVVGPMTGASMNPARSLAPALVKGDFTHLWIYIFAPIIGACLGALTYEWIRCHNPDVKSKHGCC